MEAIQVRSFQENDFQTVQQLNKEEGWTNLVEKHDETLCSWLNSEPALIAMDGNEIIGYLRGLTDSTTTLYVCELLVKKEYRKNGIAERLVNVAHECYPSTRVEMLATQESQGYYENNGYRAFYGYRKAAEEL
ncbi:GNAT family N-acetyltransferase [Halobacillus litoralis]|uniref:GNAT family N-acetyltransferase n=1 Tax=Halobacillus litoralis TaxID=45668 RepID=UPI001CD80E1B|nr:GNAT family N-acetyltransferase [Halobacillus litoralis]MCA0971870.1 GNAT family N-acetyltransferase [Halobacillus litoralis]